MSMLMEDEENDEELLGVEIVRHQDKDFVYQLWNNDDHIEVDIIGETYLDSDNEEHVNATYVEGRIDRIEEDEYEWCPAPHTNENTEMRVARYEEGFSPDIEEPESLNQVAELERIMESAFNDESIRY